MKTLIIGFTNTVFLDAAFTNSGDMTATATVVGEDGIAVKAADGSNLENLNCTFDADINKWKVDVTLFATTATMFARIYWRVLDKSLPVLLPEEFDPELVHLRSMSILGQQEAVPVDYFLDYVVAAKSKMDDGYAEAVANYPRNGLKSFLQAATANLENRTKLTLFTKDIDEQHDYQLDLTFGDTFWIQQLYERPVVSITSWELYHGGTKILEVPTVDLKIESIQGTVEYVPTSASGSLLFQSLYASNDAIRMAVIGRGRATRLPCAWRIKYKAGLNFTNLPLSDKENWRLAIARNALIELIPIIDPATRVNSESESMDGVSMSSSKNMESFIKNLRASEDQWIKNIEKKYVVGFDMVIV